MDSPATFNFLQLPDKFVNRLLKYLSVYQLMNLRLLCKQSKSWVERPDNLKSLIVPVKTRKFLKSLLKCGVNWSRLVISCDCDDPTSVAWIRSDDYFKLFAKLGGNLRSLKFTEQRIPFTNGVDKIIQNCPGLQELELGTLDLQRVEPVVEEVLKNLQGLKTLGILFTAWDTEEDLKWFGTVLNAAKSLEYFKVPFILSSSVYNLYPSLDVDEIDRKLNEITDRWLFNPIKTLLQKSSMLRSLQVENFDVEQLLQNGLVQTCYENNCRLHSVLECFERELTAEETQHLGGIVASLLNVSKYLDLRTLNNLEEITIVDSSTESSDTNKLYVAPNSLPVLSTIKITLTTSILQSERMAFVFLQQLRPSVKSVSVIFQQDLRGSPQASVFRTPVFVKSFPNLVHLHLNGFDGKSVDYLLFWSNFSKLERLQLENCRTLNDSAVIGEDPENPAFLQLSKLPRLSCEYCGDLTDTFLTTVVSKLHLETLTLAISKATFSKGLASLGNESSSLRKSLQVFNCLQPAEDCTDATFKAFLSTKTFPNLKKSEILF